VDDHLNPLAGGIAQEIATEARPWPVVLMCTGMRPKMVIALGFSLATGCGDSAPASLVPDAGLSMSGDGPAPNPDQMIPMAGGADAAPNDIAVDGPAADSSPSLAEAETACTGYAAVTCEELGRCAQAVLVGTYGDLAGCRERSKVGCLRNWNAPGSRWTPSYLEACTRALAGLSCDADSPPACTHPPGTFAEGAPCALSAQCQGLYCKKPTLGLCGTCTTRGVEGGSCERSFDCRSGSWCKNKVCTTMRKLDEPCDATQRCATGLACIGEASGSGVCAKHRGLGEPCDPQGLECDFLSESLECRAPAGSTTGICQRAELAQPGQPCGAVEGTISGRQVTCVAFARCSSELPPGVCVAPAADGAPCGGATGCLAGALCVAGTCRLADPAACQ